MQPEALRLGLIGYPLGHSLSRELHMAALKSANLPGEYLLYPVPPLPFGEAELASMMLKLRSGEIHGVNLTIPHKQSLLASMDMLSSVASEVQAINTIAYDQGKLIGWNTDVEGFLADLARSAPGLISPELGFSESGEERKYALILGAGGSARAVVYALRQAGFQVCVAARRFEQAHALHDLGINLAVNKEPNESHNSLKGCFPAAIELNTAALEALLEKFSIHLLVNTTPLGMAPIVQDCPWPSSLELPKGVLVYDLVYNPAPTLLVQRAKSAGLSAFNGLGMLVEQAALAFEIWTTRYADRSAMEAAARAALESTKIG